MKKVLSLCMALLLSAACALPVSAAKLSHTVVRGDTMWKLAVKYQVGTREIIDANPQVANPDLIYPGQILTIPQVDSTVSSYESEVIRLVNEQRAKNGLKPLTANWEPETLFSLARSASSSHSSVRSVLLAMSS